MDQIVLDILSIVIGGAGLFVVITKYNIPETRENFLGRTNIFKEKANIIDEVMTWIFTPLSVLGLLALIIKDIYSDVIPARLHTQGYYWFVFLFSILFAYALVNVLDRVGKKFARKKWLPMVLDGYREVFELTKNDWLSNNQEKAQRGIELMEKALDIKPKQKDLPNRFDQIKIFFE